MVETITPVVHGGRRAAWGWFLALHVAGATLAAGAFGALLGLAGGALRAPWAGVGLIAVALAGLVYLLREALGARVPVPQARRQVPDWWRTYFPFGPSAFLYGVGLGVGFLTYLTHGTLVVVAVGAVASGRPWLGALLLAPFGAARGATAVVARGARTPEASATLVRRLADAASWRGWRAGHLIVLGAIVTAAVVSAVDGASWRVEDLGDAAAATLAVAFGAAGLTKVVASRRWQRALRAYAIPRPLEGAVLVGVPVAELVIGILAVVGLPATAGIGAAALLSAFSVAIVVARVRRGPQLACGCFGGVATLDYRVLLARNALFGAVAVVALAAGVDRASVGSVSMPRGDEVLPAALVIAGTVLSAWAVASAVRWLRGGRIAS